MAGHEAPLTTEETQNPEKFAGKWLAMIDCTKNHLPERTDGRLFFGYAIRA